MAGAFCRFAVNIRVSAETMPNARNAYSVGKTPPRSPAEPIESHHAMAAAAKPHREEMVRGPVATSRRTPHFGHTTLSECAATSGAGISVLQWGQTRTATGHLRFGRLTIDENASQWKDLTRLFHKQRAHRKIGAVDVHEAANRRMGRRGTACRAPAHSTPPKFIFIQRIRD